jgi:hypothetical protein
VVLVNAVEKRFYSCAIGSKAAIRLTQIHAAATSTMWRKSTNATPIFDPLITSSIIHQSLHAQLVETEWERVTPANRRKVKELHAHSFKDTHDRQTTGGLAICSIPSTSSSPPPVTLKSPAKCVESL